MAASDSDSIELFVSGRLCLFGEHSDWAGEHKGRAPSIPEGRTLVVGTQEGIHATAMPLKEKILRITTTDHQGVRHGPLQLPLEPAQLLEVARSGGFFSYVAGTAYRLAVSHELPGGLQLDNHTTTLPLGKGLSSSAAVCVLVARAFNHIYNLRLSTRGEMEVAYQGEIATPSKCGRMDQACAYGSVPVCMTFDGDILAVERVTLAATLHLVLVDLKAAKDTTTILKSLQAAYPHPESELHAGLHSLLGDVNLRVTGAALQAMAAGDVEGLGRLMVEAQEAFDRLAGPLCPEQLTAPVLHKAFNKPLHSPLHFRGPLQRPNSEDGFTTRRPHWLRTPPRWRSVRPRPGRPGPFALCPQVLSYPAIQPYVWGGKGVGSQGDGTAQFLCRGPREQAQVCSILSSQLGVDCMPLAVQSTGIPGQGEKGPGAGSA